MDGKEGESKMASISKRGRGGRVVWVVRWRDPDGSSRQLTCETKALAEEHRRRLGRFESLGERYDPHRRRTAPALQDCIVSYLEARSVTLAAGTLRLRAVTLADFLRFALQDTRQKAPKVSVLSRGLVQRYHHHLLTRDTAYFTGADGRKRIRHKRCSPATAHDRVVHVASLWRWLHDHDEHGEWVERPRRVDTVPSMREQRPAPTWAQMDRAIESAHESGLHWAHLFFVLRCTGLRKSQAMRLRWEDVDLEGRLLRIRGELGKTRQERRGRTVPMAQVLVDEISTWGVREGWLVQLPEGQSRDMHHKTPRDIWIRAGLPEELAGSAHHSFRRGFISELARAGVRSEVRKYLTGHSRGTHGDTYTDPFALAVEAREAVDLVPEVGASTGVVPMSREA